MKTNVYLLQYSTYDYYNKYVTKDNTTYNNKIKNAYNEYKQNKSK